MIPTIQKLVKHQAIQDQFWMDAEMILPSLNRAAKAFALVPSGDLNSLAAYALEMVIREVLLRQLVRELDNKETTT